MAERILTPAATLFAEHIRTRGITKVQAAKELGISGASVTYLTRGDMRPKNQLAIRIERWSGGAVPAAEWADDEDRAKLAAVEAPPTPPEPPTDPGTKAA